MIEAMKASDITDREFLRIVDRLSHTPWPITGSPTTGLRWVLRMEVEAEMPDVPWKVLLAKARKLIRRGLLDGCPCGCRGDYELTEAGRALLTPPSAPPGGEK